MPLNCGRIIPLAFHNESKMNSPYINNQLSIYGHVHIKYHIHVVFKNNFMVELK